MIKKEQVYAKIRHSGNLPTLPEILVKILDACEDEATPLADIAAIISKDPVLSFKVLNLVNSAYFGLPHRLNTIEQAVVYLGADSVKNVAVTTSIHQVFEAKRFRQIKTFSLSRFWYHSLMTATLARRIARKTGFVNHDEAYLSGLLHDVGRLVLISTFPEEHRSILIQTEDARNMVWAESQLIGVSHCEVGAWLIANWKLNSLMAEAVRCHHEPVERVNESFPLVRIVYFANALCSELPNGDEDIEQSGDLLFGLSGGDIEEIVAGATDEVEDIAQNLGIRISMPQAPFPASTGEGREPETDGPEEKGVALAEPDDAGDEGTADRKLADRIKGVSMLSGLLEHLIKAGDSDAAIEGFEQCVNVLFGIDKIIFFFPDKEGMLLTARTSSANSLHQLSTGLILPIKRSSSRIVKVYGRRSSGYLTPRDAEENAADAQVLAALRSRTVMLVPIAGQDEPGGVVLLGLPATAAAVSADDLRLIQLFAKQIGLSLSLERNEARKAEELEAERIAAISMTARKFAHEVNNPLGIISNYLTSLKLKLPQAEEVQEELSIIDDEIARISSMINELDLFSEQPFNDFQMTDVNGVIEGVVKLVRSSLFTDASTVISFMSEPGVPHIVTSPHGVKQIVMNLVKNAAEAMTAGGRIEVLTRPAGEGGRERVELVVSDTGPGLPDKVVADMYKPFVTTKGEGHSGLGLSIVHKAVKDLGGTISCESNPSTGTAFTVYLPSKRT